MSNLTDISDVIIIGSGPAGLSAAIYVVRAGLSVTVIEKEFMGTGQIADSSKVDNYLGIPAISGYDLGESFREHALSLGVTIEDNNVTNMPMIKSESYGIYKSERSPSISMFDGTIIGKQVQNSIIDRTEEEYKVYSYKEDEYYKTVVIELSPMAKIGDKETNLIEAIALAQEGDTIEILRNIEVKNGGKFSSNYDDYGSQFLTGSSINGQLILNDGAILENSSIYSNTNFISNGHIIRQNTNPVIVVKGKVTVDGQVFVKGDEAATGQDETTGKSLSGQPAIRIENGSLDIKKDSVVAVFGGGYIATTSVGGSGIILDNGSISGEGTLIAFGGNGTYDDGADAISGNGTVSVKNVYAQGGCSSIPKTGATAGKAIADGVTLAKTSNRTLLNGKEIKDNYGTISELYWSSITKVPDVSKYVIEVNGSDEEDNTKPGSSEDKPNTKPGTSEKKPETKPASGSTVKKTIKTKSLKVKKTKVTLKKGKKYKIQAKKIPASSTAKIMYRSSNKRIAKVTKKGVIKALKKGKCKITVKTSDGKKKVIIVKVK